MPTRSPPVKWASRKGSQIVWRARKGDCLPKTRPRTGAQMRWPGQTELRQQTIRNWPETIPKVRSAVKEIPRTEIKMEIAANRQMADKPPPGTGKTARAARAATISNRQITVHRDRKMVPDNAEKAGSNRADRTAATNQPQMAPAAMRIVCGSSPSGWVGETALWTTAARSPETIL